MIDARLTVTALKVVIERRKPPSGSVHHSNRRSQCAARAHREILEAHGLIGSMGRLGNPDDNAKAESFMKTRKVEAICPMACESFADVAEDLPRYIDEVYNSRRLDGPQLSEPATVRGQARPADGQISSLINVHPQERTPVCPHLKESA